VVTKPGYGIIAECIANQRPMLYTSRGAFREYDLLVAEMPRYLRCAYIGRGDLHAGRWRAGLRDAFTRTPAPERIATDGASVAAAAVAALIGGV
jgi:hypothetical protein